MRKSSFKNCLAILILIGGFIFQLNAQTTEVFEDWATYKGTQNMFFKNFTTTDLNRNVFVAGATLNASGDYDILLTKYDTEGVEQWTQQYAGAGNGDDVATSLCFDNNGNIYLTGTVFESTSQVENCITIKYNQNGVQQWVRTFNGNASGIDFGTSIKADIQNNVYVSGASTQTNNLLDFLVIKYDQNGTLQWSNTYNHISLNDVSNRINLFDDIVVVAGGAQVTTNEWEYAITEFDANTGNYLGVSVTNSSGTGIDNIKDLTIDQNGFLYVTGGIVNSNNGYDYYTMKLDTSLNVLWSATYNGNSNLDDIANSVDVDFAGNVYVTGSSNTTNQGKDWVTIKYNSSGIQQWTASFNDNYDEDDEANALALDNSGNIYVAGYTYNGDNQDYKTIKYDPNGNIKWEIEFNSLYNDDDKATNITVDNNGDIIVAGQSYIGTDYKFVTVKYVEEEIIIPPDPEALSNALSFDENRGQLLNTSNNTTPDIKYYSNAFNQSLYFTDEKLSYVISQKNESENTQEYSRVDMSFVNSTPTKVRALNVNEDYKNFYYPHISEGRERVRNYDNLIYKDVFEYVDVVFLNNNRGLKYYFVVKPTANANAIKVNYTGANSISTNSNNELIISTNLGDIKQAQPAVFQIDANGNRVSLAWQPTYVVNGTQVSFTMGSYNTSLPLVIQVDKGNSSIAIQQNKNMVWSTYFGSTNGSDYGYSVVNNNGNTYIGGYTQSTDFPTTSGAYQTLGSSSFSNGFFTKFGNYRQLVYSTYIGGNKSDIINSLNLFNNSIYATGYTYSSDFPTIAVNGATNDVSFNGQKDAFLLQINTVNGYPIWSRYIGTNGIDECYSLSSNNSHIFIVGSLGNGFQLQSNGNALFNNYSGGGTDGFIAKFDIQNSLVWATYYGGSNIDYAYSCKLDNNDNLFVWGWTKSSNITTKKPNFNNNAFVQNYSNGDFDFFILRLNSNGVKEWATYFGGLGLDKATKSEGIICNSNGVYFFGTTTSTNISTLLPLQSSFGGIEDGLIAGFDYNCNRVYTSYWGGSDIDNINAACTDANGNIYITGNTKSGTNFPLFPSQSNQLFTQNYGGSSNYLFGDAFISVFNKYNNSLLWSSYIGGDGNSSPLGGDVGYSININNNKLYILGSSNSTNPKYPLVDPGNPAYYNNISSAFGKIVISEFEINNTPLSIYKYSLNGINIYPNPTSSYLLIDLHVNKTQQIEVRVFDYTGKLIISKNEQVITGKNTLSINVNSLSKGFYIVKIGSDYSSKFLKF